MPWSVAAPVLGAVAGSVASSALSSDKNGGAGTQTATKEPWKAAEPWLLQNIAGGQALQDKYTAQPFSAQQTAAYNNQYGLNDYARTLFPNLLGQISSQQVGFDRSNPSARPMGYNFGVGGATGLGGTGSGLMPNLGQTSLMSAAPAPTAAAPAPTESPLGSFLQQVGGGPNSMAPRGSGTAGSFGAFKYGDQPQPGTQAYRDMTEYFNYGGADPRNMYGRGMAMLNGYGYDGVGNGGNGSVGGSPGSDGSGGGSVGGNC